MIRPIQNNGLERPAAAADPPEINPDQLDSEPVQVLPGSPLEPGLVPLPPFDGPNDPTSQAYSGPRAQPEELPIYTFPDNSFTPPPGFGLFDPPGNGGAPWRPPQDGFPIDPGLPGFPSGKPRPNPVHKPLPWTNPGQSFGPNSKPVATPKANPPGGGTNPSSTGGNGPASKPISLPVITLPKANPPVTKPWAPSDPKPGGVPISLPVVIAPPIAGPSMNPQPGGVPVNLPVVTAPPQGGVKPGGLMNPLPTSQPGGIVNPPPTNPTSPAGLFPTSDPLFIDLDLGQYWDSHTEQWVTMTPDQLKAVPQASAWYILRPDGTWDELNVGTTSAGTGSGSGIGPLTGGNGGTSGVNSGFNMDFSGMSQWISQMEQGIMGELNMLPSGMGGLSGGGGPVSKSLLSAGAAAGNANSFSNPMTMNFASALGAGSGANGFDTNGLSNMFGSSESILAGLPGQFQNSQNTMNGIKDALVLHNTLDMAAGIGGLLGFNL